MHVRVTLLLLPLLGGCMTNSIRTPGKLADDATGAMWTLTPVEGLATCIASATGGSIQPSGDGYVVTVAGSRPTTYAIDPNPKPGVYPTQVTIRAASDQPDTAARAAGCLGRTARPS